MKDREIESEKTPFFVCVCVCVCVFFCLFVCLILAAASTRA